MAGNSRPGWYDDPDDAMLLRYWDGNGWTEHTAPRSAPPSGPPRLRDMPPPSVAQPAVQQPPRKPTPSDRFAALPALWRGLIIAAAVVAGAGIMVASQLAEEEDGS